MEIIFAQDGTLQIKGARITYRNFSGEGSKFNREGDRNFVVIIPSQDIADALLERGWNVKIKAPRVEGEEPFMYMKVKVAFTDWGPHAYLISGNNKNKLDEESISILDRISIANADMHLRPYDWEVQGRTGRTAYLKAIQVTQRIDDPYAEEYPEF